MGTHIDRPGRVQEAAGARQQWRVEIDGCLKRQNPAYRLTAPENRCLFRQRFSLFLHNPQVAGTEFYCVLLALLPTVQAHSL